MLRWSQSEHTPKIIRRDGIFAAMCDSEEIAVFVVDACNRADPPLPERVCEYCGVGMGQWKRRCCCARGIAVDRGFE